MNGAREGRYEEHYCDPPGLKGSFHGVSDPARTAGMEPMLCERGPITVRAGPSNHPGIRVL